MGSPIDLPLIVNSTTLSEVILIAIDYDPKVIESIVFCLFITDMINTMIIKEVYQCVTS